MASQAENALIGRAALQTFQPGDLVALRCNEPLQIGQLAQQFHQQSFQLGTWQIGQTGGRRHATSESYSPAFDKPKKPELPGVMPRLLRELVTCLDCRIFAALKAVCPMVCQPGAKGPKL